MTKKAAYIASLKKQHVAVDDKVTAMQKQPACCATALRELKKEKLRLKQLISNTDADESEDDVPEGSLLELLTDDHVSPTTEIPLREPQTATA